MTKYVFKVTRGQIYKIPENTKNQSSPPDQFLVFASSYNSSLAVPAEMSIISLTESGSTKQGIENIFLHPSIFGLLVPS